MLYTLLKLGVLFAIGGLTFLTFNIVQFSSKANISVPNTFVASTTNIASTEEQASITNLQEDYLFSKKGTATFADFTEETIDPSGFYLRIDSINLFKAIVKDVDPRVKETYVQSWNYGISHGKFTATPDQIGLTYLFAHATGNKTAAEEENAWFSYMDKVKTGDEVIIYYEGIKYTYSVSEIHEVSPTATGFYTGVSPVPKIRMQYCGPPTGSLSSRTLVDALLVSKQKL